MSTNNTFAKLFSNKPITWTVVLHEEFVGVFRKAGGFTRGIGIHYNESLVVNSTYQSLATSVIAGERMPPQTIIRVADSWLFELQDLLPADTRFTVLFFTGDYLDPVQKEKVLALAQSMSRPESFLQKFIPKGARSSDAFELITIAASRKEEITYNDFPKIFRPHWSRIYTDDIDFTGKVGGKAYASFGVGHLVPSSLSGRTNMLE
ncbi:thioredoxin-like protein [Neolentinus lepideus HHB14362 ss-1]|uniref:Thioredoxin-like protein n=1 Tax=Neolentinus lepideus HHB14362 ss-1 TaxID=1314782 RepID=A0A165SL30_9AGAM|nr:thioredoxin-like protein [Neolentinus lepideus HHB14362 ss-1]